MSVILPFNIAHSCIAHTYFISMCHNRRVRKPEKEYGIRFCLLKRCSRLEWERQENSIQLLWFAYIMQHREDKCARYTVTFQLSLMKPIHTLSKHWMKDRITSAKWKWWEIDNMASTSAGIFFFRHSNWIWFIKLNRGYEPINRIQITAKWKISNGICL